MGYLRVHCKRCGNMWNVYHRDNWHDDRARECPVCYSAIDEELWEKQVLPAFGAMSDANRELIKHSSGSKTGSAFRIDYHSNPVIMRGK